MQALSECFTDLQENILVVVRHREEDLEPVCAVGESHRSLRDKPIIRRRDRNLLDRLRVKRVPSSAKVNAIGTDFGQGLLGLVRHFEDRLWHGGWGPSGV